MTTSLGLPRRSVKSPDFSMLKAHLIVRMVAHLCELCTGTIAVVTHMELTASGVELDGVWIISQ